MITTETSSGLVVKLDLLSPGSSTRASVRCTGFITASIGDADVGELSFGVHADACLVRTTNYQIVPGYRRKGLARLLFVALMDEYPGHEVAESGYPKSSDGEALLDALRMEGLPYHGSSCFSAFPYECHCALGGRLRR